MKSNNHPNSRDQNRETFLGPPTPKQSFRLPLLRDVPFEELGEKSFGISPVSLLPVNSSCLF